jgi:hypothetical protein
MLLRFHIGFWECWMSALQYPNWKYDRSVSPGVWNTSIRDLLKMLWFLFELLEETNFDVASKDPRRKDPTAWTLVVPILTCQWRHSATKVELKKTSLETHLKVQREFFVIVFSLIVHVIVEFFYWNRVVYSRSYTWKLTASDEVL